MTKKQLPNPFKPDPDILKEFNSLLYQLVSDCEPSKGPDYFYRRTTKFTDAEVRAMKEKMQPYLDKGWLDSVRSQYAFDFMASK